MSIMKQYPNLIESTGRPDSQKDMGHFKFPTPIFTDPALQNDIVFCGKVMIPQTKPGPVTERTKKPLQAKSESFRKPAPVRNQRSGSFRLPATGNSQLLRRSNSCRRRFNVLFGAVKFPVQMELNDMRKRQDRREKAPLPEIPAGFNGELVTSGARKSCWKRKGHFLGAFAASAIGVFRWFDSS